MKLIGIRIDQAKTSTSVTKNLKEEWYPFLDIYRLRLNTDQTNKCLRNDFQKVLDKNKDSKTNNLYSSTDNDQPEIFVHAIAGMNGSGKSSILEVLYRLINNLAYDTIGNEDRMGSAPLLCAMDFSSTLFYEINKKVHYLDCKWDEERRNSIVKIDGQAVVKDRLNEFFYSIVVNYSHYALNTNEIIGYTDMDIPEYYIFKKDLMSIINGKAEKNTIRNHWLNGLFHKNDGYTTPIVISPMRTEGNFNINGENYLSKQRLIGLFILYKIHDDKFLDNYNPLTLEYTLNAEDTNAKIANYEKLWSNQKGGFIPFLRRLMIFWDNALGCQYGIEGIIEDKNTLSITNNLKISHEYLTKLLFEYIACKTISISTKYNNFKSVLNIEPNKSISDDELNTFITKIIDEPSHITLKINQCIQYLKDVKDHKCYIDDIEAKVGIDNKIRLDIDKFIKDHSFEKNDKLSVDDVFNVMLPPIFDIDIELQPIKSKETVTLSSMSSGERQMLYSMSSVLYHLRNIHSIDETDRIKYKHVSIILDEVEMYYHPEYQRQYINKLLKLITGLKLDKKKIESINICVVTHSPFILSDILKQNILFLKEGEVKNEEVKIETFGANFYDILRSSFFLEKNALGEFVDAKLREVIQRIEIEEGIITENKNGKGIKNGKIKTRLISIDEAREIINLLGDPFLKGYLTNKIDKYVSNKI